MIKVTAKVEGMMCPMCEAHVNDAVRNALAVNNVSSSHKDGTTVVIAEEIDNDKLRAAIEATGYKVSDITAEPYEKKGFFARLFKK